MTGTAILLIVMALGLGLLAGAVRAANAAAANAAAVAALAMLAVAIIVLAGGPARSQDRGAWFKSLRQPGSGFSCCDISDCKRTQADWRGGQWWAVVVGEWTPIPPDKELETPSIDGDAYVCSSPNRRIYCFVRPDFGT